MNRAAWRSLAPGLSAAIFMVLAGGGLLWLSWSTLQQVEDEAHVARRASEVARARLERMQQDEPQIRHTLQRLDKLLGSGLVGPAQRLDWADRMRTIARQRRLDDLSFEIAPQRTLGSLDLRDEYAVQASAMRVNATLLHEGDLLRLLADLRGPVTGQTLPRRCVLERLGGTPSSPANLRLQCDIDWINIEQSATRPGASP